MNITADPNSYKPLPVTYELKIADNFVVHCTGKVPNRFHRWTMKFVFGFIVIPRKEKTL